MSTNKKVVEMWALGGDAWTDHLKSARGDDADDYNGRPHKPGEWLPLPHADSPTVKP